MYNLDLTKGKYPIIIKPNMGQPILINLRDYKDDTGKIIKKIFFEAFIIAIPNQNIKEILEFFHLNIFIQPILKDEGEFVKRRGEKYHLNIAEIKRIERLDLKLRDQAVLEEENCIVWDLFKNLRQVDNIFGKRKNLYIVRIEVKNIKAIEKILNNSNRASLLFDIIHDVPNSTVNKVNYHSIAFFDKDWSDFKFIHATDFHIARRNDFLIKFLKDKAKDKVKRLKTRKLRPLREIPFILKRDFEFRKGLQDYRIGDLRNAKLNFNYNLRLLIKFINEQVSKGELDFVLMTGDLVDYIRIGRGNYQYKNNFEVFIEILLGLNRGLDKYPYLVDDEFNNKREILAPIFTLVGNHDYRKGHYTLRVGSIHKIFGLTKKDIRGYYDIKFANYLISIHSKDKFLRDYYRYINPNLNYRLKIGNEYNFIFLETGQDSLADMHDLLKGGPSTKGIKEYQVELLRAYIKLSHDEKIIIVMHTPPISPNLGAVTQYKFKRKFKLKRKVKWSDFYEENLKNYLGNARLERILNLKYQTIMYNWATFLRICTGSDIIVRRKVDLILCGHTHTIKEFRLKEAREPEKISMGFYFTKISIVVPCEVYASLYRDTFKAFKNSMDLKIWFDVNKPFIFQTQAVGPISLKYKFKPPGFRYFVIKNNQIIRANIYSLHYVFY